MLKEAVRKKRNKNAPGINGIPFLVYKKCPKVLDMLLEVLNRAWETKGIPSSWQKAIIVLLAKSDDLKSPAEFRPIAGGEKSLRQRVGIGKDRAASFTFLGGSR